MSIIQSTTKSSGEFYDYPIEQSLRFDGSSYLSSSLSSTSTFTISMWVKGSGGNSDYLFKSGTDVGLNWVTPSDDGRMYMHAANVAVGYGERYRDISAWYHVVLQSNLGTARFWVNNRAATTDGSTAATRASFTFTGTTYIGCYSTAAPNFHGYMANIHFIDGQALTASSFGETKSGVWIPKAYTGSYGTNGFHLTFENGIETIGGVANQIRDESSNSNHWTKN